MVIFLLLTAFFCQHNSAKSFMVLAVPALPLSGGKFPLAIDMILPDSSLVNYCPLGKEPRVLLLSTVAWVCDNTLSSMVQHLPKPVAFSISTDTGSPMDVDVEAMPDSVEHGHPTCYDRRLILFIIINGYTLPCRTRSHLMRTGLV